jgi:hypothetical protein
LNSGRAERPATVATIGAPHLEWYALIDPAAGDRRSGGGRIGFGFHGFRHVIVVFAVVLAVFCAVWVPQALLVLRNLSRMKDLRDLEPPPPAEWPRVSVLMPARNEQTGIGPSIESRLADGYPDLEIVAIDDRSEDDTGRIIAEFAARDPRVRPVRIDSLPAGWLGKIHALDAGVKAAAGEWLLLSDADIEVERGMLAKAVAHCEANDLDLLALLPEYRSPSGVVAVLWAVFVRIMAMAADPAAVRKPHSKAAVGSGAFTLVRRRAYDATPGFQHLRLETADDMAFGAMAKAAGARCDFVGGRGAARLVMYESFGAYLRGVEKNGGSFAGTPFAVVAAGFALAACIEWSPIAALALGIAGGLPWLAAVGGVAALLATLATVAALRRNTGSVLPGLLWPVGWLLVAAGVLRSAWLIHRRGGAIWRGTFYPMADLIAGRRYRIGKGLVEPSARDGVV